MPDGAAWHSLRQTLDRCADEGRTITFWLRDDDAVAPSEALDRLCRLTDEHGVPLLLAIIPKHAGAPLRDYLAAHGHVSPAQHGFNHRNYAAPAERAQELGLHRPLSDVLVDLSTGRASLKNLFAESLLDVLVPPWNRIDDRVVEALPSLGFNAVSRFGIGDPASQTALTFVNSHIDIMNWKNGRKGRAAADLIHKIKAHIHCSGVLDHPIGILAHHLAHDETAWRFLTELFQLSRDHPAVRWTSFENCRAMTLASQA